MMQTGDKFLSVLAAVLIVLAFVLKAMILRHIALASEPTSTA